jgi:hypothetical protein
LGGQLIKQLVKLSKQGIANKVSHGVSGRKAQKVRVGFNAKVIVPLLF